MSANYLIDLQALSYVHTHPNWPHLIVDKKENDDAKASAVLYIFKEGLGIGACFCKWRFLNIRHTIFHKR